MTRERRHIAAKGGELSRSGDASFLWNRRGATVDKCSCLFSFSCGDDEVRKNHARPYAAELNCRDGVTVVCALDDVMEERRQSRGRHGAHQ